MYVAQIPNTADGRYVCAYWNSHLHTQIANSPASGKCRQSTATAVAPHRASPAKNKEEQKHTKTKTPLEPQPLVNWRCNRNLANIPRRSASRPSVSRSRSRSILLQLLDGGRPSQACDLRPLFLPLFLCLVICRPPFFSLEVLIKAIKRRSTGYPRGRETSASWESTSC